MLDLVALGIVPAAAAGLLAFAHTNRPYWGGMVAICILVVSQLVSRTRYPLHLMPVARLAVCGLIPFLGGLLAWAVALSVGTGSLGDSLIPAVRRRSCRSRPSAAGSGTTSTGTWGRGSR